MAIVETNKRDVSGEQLRNALAIGLSKVLKKSVSPDSIGISNAAELVLFDDITVTCLVTPRVKVPRKAKGKPAV